MNIVGFTKLTLVDFPNKVSAIVFTEGCNFRCPYCQNASIVLGKYPVYDEQEIFDYLIKRKNILDGLCISGGEPLLQNDLKQFITKVKALGYAVKIDTNGFMPTQLKQLIEENLVDYVAMDIKNCLAKYPQTVGKAQMQTENILKSIEILKNSGIDYEFRTTLVKEFHNYDDMEQIGKLIAGEKHYYLQNFEESGDILQDGLHGFEPKELNEFKKIAEKYASIVDIRNIE
ncbi:MAG: anaerobic ribonucleoside-triphosphate reductase activating protein [Clostridia bacterium]